MIKAQLITILTYAFIAWWYVAPRLNRLDKRDALTALLWVHVFRYVVLYLYVAKQEGYGISERAMTGLVMGDLTGAALAALAIILLRFRSRVGVWAASLVVLATLADMVDGFIVRSSEPPRADALGVWWMLFVFFAPLILISLPLLIWQLYVRRGQSLGRSAVPQKGAAHP
jgi:hypothetical protein